jgi:hypothetical protein
MIVSKETWYFIQYKVEEHDKWIDYLPGGRAMLYDSPNKAEYVALSLRGWEISKSAKLRIIALEQKVLKEIA